MQARASRLPTTYQRAPPTTSSYYLLPSVAEDAVSIFLLQNSGKTAAASLRRTPRAFLTGGTLVVRVDVSTTRLQIGIVRPVYRPYLWTLPRDAGHSLMVK